MVPFSGNAVRCHLNPLTPRTRRPRPVPAANSFQARHYSGAGCKESRCPNLINGAEVNPSSSTVKGGPRMYPSQAVFSDFARILESPCFRKGDLALGGSS